jgi:hypothetical protein
LWVVDQCELTNSIDRRLLFKGMHCDAG